MIFIVWPVGKWFTAQLKQGKLQRMTSKKNLFLLVLLLGTSSCPGGGVSVDPLSEFRFLGGQHLNEDTVKNKLTLLAQRDDVELEDILLKNAGTLFSDLYHLENACRNSDPKVRETAIDQLAKDLKEIRKNPSSVLILRSCYALVLESLARILQSPGVSLLTKEQLQKALSPELWDDDKLKFFRTYAAMLLLARELVEYRLRTGALPQNLTQVTAAAHDAWGNPIQYRVDHEKYLLWSGNRGAKGPEVVQGYMPSFGNYDVLVFSEEFSEWRKKLYDDGQIVMPSGFQVILTKGDKVWTLSGHRR